MAQKVVVLGASGQIARHVIESLGKTDAQLTLFARNVSRVQAPTGANVVQATVLDPQALARVIVGQDIVYANLTGDDIDHQAAAIVSAMDDAGVSRLIFVLSLGIYDEVPGAFGRWNRQMIGEVLKPFARAAAVIEASDLDYTIIRPAWLTDRDEVDYETTSRHEPFKGTEVSRRSVAALITHIIEDPTIGSRDSLGVDKPGTDGDKPSFY